MLLMIDGKWRALVYNFDSFILNNKYSFMFINYHYSMYDLMIIIQVQ